jgi:hypothetical protein
MTSGFLPYFHATYSPRLCIRILLPLLTKSITEPWRQMLVTAWRTYYGLSLLTTEETTCNIKLAAYQGSTQQSGSTNSATLNPVILAATSLVADPHFAVTAIRHTYIHFPVRDGPYSMSSLIPKPGGKWGCFQTKPEGTAMSQEGALPKEHVSPEAPLS